MNEDHTEHNQIAPLSRLLFGWTLERVRVGVLLGAPGVLGALLIAAEIMFGRASLDLPYEELPGFYALLGAVSVGLTIAVAFVLRAATRRLRAPEEET